MPVVVKLNRLLFSKKTVSLFKAFDKKSSFSKAVDELIQRAWKRPTEAEFRQLAGKIEHTLVTDDSPRPSTIILAIAALHRLSLEGPDQISTSPSLKSVLHFLEELPNNKLSKSENRSLYLLASQYASFCRERMDVHKSLAVSFDGDWGGCRAFTFDEFNALLILMPQRESEDGDPLNRVDSSDSACQIRSNFTNLRSFMVHVVRLSLTLNRALASHDELGAQEWWQDMAATLYYEARGSLRASLYLLMAVIIEQLIPVPQESRYHEFLANYPPQSPIEDDNIWLNLRKDAERVRLIVEKRLTRISQANGFARLCPCQYGLIGGEIHLVRSTLKALQSEVYPFYFLNYKPGDTTTSYLSLLRLHTAALPNSLKRMIQIQSLKDDLMQFHSSFSTFSSNLKLQNTYFHESAEQALPAEQSNDLSEIQNCFDIPRLTLAPANSKIRRKMENPRKMETPSQTPNAMHRILKPNAVPDRKLLSTIFQTFDMFLKNVKAIQETAMNQPVIIPHKSQKMSSPDPSKSRGSPPKTGLIENPARIRKGSLRTTPGNKGDNRSFSPSRVISPADFNPNNLRVLNDDSSSGQPSTARRIVHVESPHLDFARPDKLKCVTPCFDRTPNMPDRSRNRAAAEASLLLTTGSALVDSRKNLLQKSAPSIVGRKGTGEFHSERQSKSEKITEADKQARQNSPLKRSYSGIATHQKIVDGTCPPIGTEHQWPSPRQQENLSPISMPRESEKGASSSAYPVSNRNRNDHQAPHRNQPPVKPRQTTIMSTQATSAVSVHRVNSGVPIHDNMSPYVLDWQQVKIEKNIGSGATSEVHRGWWQGTEVAIKIFKQSGRWQDVNLVREIQIVFKLRHPNLVLVMGYLPPSQSVPAGLVCEFCAGGTLFDHMYSKPRLTWKQILKIGTDIAKGCNYLHSSTPPIIHRDLKSLNILLADRIRTTQETIPVAKISDFGMSVMTGWTPNLRGLAGTYHWMAPEVFLGDSYNETVDVYSYGIILYELVTGKLPYSELKGWKASEITTRVAMQGLRPNTANIPANCPLFYRKLMESCWNQKPSARPSFAQILDYLHRNS